MLETLILLSIGVASILLIYKKTSSHSDEPEYAPQSIRHRKKEFLTTPNERKLYFALQRALDSKYIIHSQVSLIALVEPIDFKDLSKSWAKRMDFVVTDTATKNVAVIELDDSSHLTEKRRKRDLYVNSALKGHHPLVRLSTQNFYEPRDIASILEAKAGIKSIFTDQEEAPTKLSNTNPGH